MVKKPSRSPERIIGEAAFKVVKGLGGVGLFVVGMTAVGVVNFFRDKKIVPKTIKRTPFPAYSEYPQPREESHRISPFHRLVAYANTPEKDGVDAWGIDLTPPARLDEGLDEVSQNIHDVIVAERAATLPSAYLGAALARAAEGLLPEIKESSSLGAEDILLMDRANSQNDIH